jgi:hypothetical protein
MYQWLLTPTFDLRDTCASCLDAFLSGAGLAVQDTAANRR